MAAANVVEIVVKSTNQTAAGFTEARAAAAETAASMDELTAAQERLAAASGETGKAMGEATIAEQESGYASKEAEAANATYQAALEREAAAAQAVADATDKAAAAQGRQADAAAAAGDTSAAASAKTAAGADDAAASQAAAGDAAAASGAKAEESGGAMAAMGSKAKLAGVAAAVGMGLAVKGAMDFNATTTRLVTSAGESAANLDKVRQGMLAISAQTDTSTAQMASGMYTVESAGFHGAQGLTVLKAAAQGAKDEGADLATVSNAVTDALVDFHEPASQAANVTSQLIAGVSHGKTTFEEFSGSMSNVLPLASAMHLKLADVTGVLAEMTAHGMSAQRASEDEANAMRSLMNPTATMSAEYAKLGTSSQQVQASLGTRGLAGTMQWLSGIAQHGATGIGQTYTQALIKLMGTAPGAQVALATTGENAKATSAAIKGIAGASADASGNVDGFSKVSDTLSFKMGAAEQSIKATGISLGEALLPALTAVMGPITSMLQLIASNKVAADAFALVVGGVLATALGTKLAGGLRDVKTGIQGVGSGAQWLIGKLTAMTGAQEAQTAATEEAAVAQGELDVAMDANPIGLIVMAVAALIAAIVLLVTHTHQVAHAFDVMRHDVAAAVDGVVRFVEQHWKLLATILATALLGPVAGLVVFLATHWKQVTADVSKLYHEVTGFFSSMWGDLERRAETGAVNTLRMFEGWGKDVLGLFESLPHRILSALGNLGSLLLNSGKQVVEGLINGIKSMIGDVGSVAGDVGHALLGGVKSVLGIASPSREMATAGQQTVQGLANGITATKAQAMRAMEQMSVQVKEAAVGALPGHAVGAASADKVIEGLTSTATEARLKAKDLSVQVRRAMADGMPASSDGIRSANAVIAGLNEQAGAAQRSAVALSARISAPVGASLASQMTSSGRKIAQGVADGITSMVGEVGHAAESVVDEVKSFLPFSPAKKGPLSGSGAPSNSGRSIARQIAQGLAAGQGEVSAAMQGLAGGVSARAGLASARGAALAGAGGGVQKFQLEITGGGDDLLTRWLRQKVRLLGGGNVQKAFGK